MTYTADRDRFFVGTSREDLRDFPLPARRRAGFELRNVQAGDKPTDFKPMRTVGPGVYEIRLREEGQAHRVFYVAKFVDAVYVLHAFEKKTQRTSKRDIEIGQRRYRQVQDERRKGHG